MLSFAMRSDWRYLLRHTREGRSRDDGERSRDDTPRDREQGHQARDYYTAGVEHGEPPGTWWGRGADSLGLRGEVTEDVMEKLYGGLTDPVTGEGLGSPPREYAKFEDRLAALLAKEPDATPERVAELELAAHKSHREARTYADLTFSPPKSWSVLHAALEHAGRHEEAAQVWDAWEAGVHAGLGYLMDEAGYSRSGYHGAKIAGRTSGRWVDAHDYVVSLWRHHTSRDGDPQMHIHAAVLNRVRCGDGVWRSLDSAAISAARPAAGAISERVAEERLTAALGVEFRTRPDGKAREIAGITKEDRDLFSSRRRAITEGVRELSAAYEAKHGTAPDRYVLRLMAQHVTLTTRARKPDHTPPREELLSRWERSIQDHLGKSLDDVLDAVHLGRERSPEPAEEVSPEKVIEQAIADAGASKAVWNRHDLVAAIVRHLPERLGGLEGFEVRALVDGIADRALTQAVDRGVITLTVPELVPVPEELRRDDGRSQFEPHRPDRYATRAQLEREESLLAAARQTGAVQVSEEQLEKLLDKTGLSGDQRAAVAEVLGSGKKLEVLVGPAGTGKSYTVGTLAELWKEAFGTGVFGLAVSQNAVGVLRDEGIERGANVAQFVDWHEKLRSGELEDRYRDEYRTRDGRLPDTPPDRYAVRQREKWEEYRDRYAIRRGQLVVIDEASMIPAAEMAKIGEIVKDADAKLLVTGDPNQLGAVGAGGTMQLLVDTVGAVRLAEVRRFAAEWEREASLRIRDGDVTALLEYDRRGRLLGGSEERMTQAAVEGFLGDHLAGKRSVLVAGDNEKAAELASKVREELAGLGLVEEDGAKLHDGTRAGAGDLIQTRRNEYRMRDARTGEEVIVINREVWRVEGTGHFGGGWLAARRDLGRDKNGEQRWGTVRHLPAEYVREHVELAYAGTVHAVQGRTVDTSHALIDAGFDLPAYYVATTRGVSANVAYIVTDGLEQHYLARLSELFERAAPERTATHVQREEFGAAEHLGRLGPVWTALIADDAAERYRHALAAVLGEERAATVAQDAASSALYRLLRSAELGGHDVSVLVEQVVSRRELGTASSIAQVLHDRVMRELARAPVDREAGAAGREDAQTRLDSEAEDFVYRSYGSRTPVSPLLPEGVSEYVHALAQQMDARAAYLAEQAALAPPVWAERLGPVPEAPLERLEWTERAQAVAAYREQFRVTSEEAPIGRHPGRGNPERRVAWEQAAVALGITGTEREMAGCTEGELANLIDAYAREEAWMPPNVDERLRTAQIAAREAAGSVARVRVQFEAAYHDDVRRIDLAERLGRAEELAARMHDRVAALEEIADVRTAAVESVAPVLAEARAAREELHRRGIDPETLRREGTEREAGPQRAREQDESARQWARDAGPDAAAGRGAEADAPEPADPGAARRAEIAERLTRLEATMGRTRGEAAPHHAAAAEHPGPERVPEREENARDRTGAGRDAPHEREAGHPALVAEAEELPVPGTPLFAGYDERVARFAAAGEHAGPEVEHPPAAGRVEELPVGTPLFAGYDERVARFAAAAGEQRAHDQGREQPGLGAGRPGARDEQTQQERPVAREGAGERAAGAEHPGARQRTEQHGTEPAEPALDPQRVWGHLTAQERYEAETDRPHAEGGRRPPSAWQPSRDLEAGELERPQAARDPRLEADLATAREAAERLAGKQEAQREWTTDEEIDYILRRARGELREGEQPPPRVEQEFQKYQQALQQEQQQRGLGREM